MLDRKLLFSVLKWIFAFAIITSLVVFIQHTEIDKIGLYLSQIGGKFLFIIAITLIAHIMGTLGWVYCFSNTPSVSFFKLFSIRMIGENVGIINPSSIVGGDGFKSYLLYKEGVKMTESISSLLISRVIMIFTQIGLFVFAAILYLLFVSQSSRLGQILLLSIGVLILLGVVIFSLFRKNSFERLTKLIGEKNLQSVQEVFENIGCYYKTSPRRFYLSALFSTVNWIIGSLEIYLIFHFLGVDISLISSLLVDQGVLVLKSFGAFVPGQLGIEEYANKIMFSIVGIIGLEIWIAASVLRRARQIFWIAISGVLYLVIKKETSSELGIISY